MDWKIEAREKLWQYEARKKALESIPEEIRRLEAEYRSIRSSAGGDASVHGESRREDAMLSNIVRREELARQLESARKWVELVDGALAVLDEERRLILERMYIHRQRGAAQRLMEELGVEKSVLYKRAEKALRLFTIALYGGVDT